MKRKRHTKRTEVSEHSFYKQNYSELVKQRLGATDAEYLALNLM